VKKVARAVGTSGRHVALLRAINVGGNNLLPMKELAGIFTAAGCEDVVTYIQSGNVVFAASARIHATLPRVIPERIKEGYGFDVPLVLRSAAEFCAAANSNPFLKSGHDETTLAVAFLRDVPHKARAAKLDPERSPADSFQLRGRDLYLHLPRGMAPTKLTNAYLDSTLGTVSTVRNWRTIQKLVSLLDE